MVLRPFKGSSAIERERERERDREKVRERGKLRESLRIFVEHSRTKKSQEKTLKPFTTPSSRLELNKVLMWNLLNSSKS